MECTTPETYQHPRITFAAVVSSRAMQSSRTQYLTEQGSDYSKARSQFFSFEYLTFQSFSRGRGWWLLLVLEGEIQHTLDHGHIFIFALQKHTQKYTQTPLCCW